jgi:hypothetical protein
MPRSRFGGGGGHFLGAGTGRDNMIDENKIRDNGQERGR